MAIWNLGSINEDRLYRVAHVPAPGETIAAQSLGLGLGGKGANLSVAAARAGARTHHIGRIGAGGVWMRDRMTEYGIDTRFVVLDDGPTGHANITLGADGENAITLFGGANRQITDAQIGAALSEAATGDWFVTQNETNAQDRAARQAKDLGLKLAYIAAPFEVAAINLMLPLIDLLVLNEVEMQQLRQATQKSIAALEVARVIVTMGAKGAMVYERADGWQGRSFAAVPVTATDTTGAGDTFAGYVLAGLDRGLDLGQSVRLASHAAALMVTRLGTADVIPDLREVQAAMGA